MFRIQPLCLFCLTLILSSQLAFAGLAGDCRVSDQPAATLLVPYFEVNLDDPSGSTTLISVNNASSKPAIARVVLWTDWAVPTLAFDVYLTGYDVQTLNIRDLFRGTLPATGTSVSPQGTLSRAASADSAPGCESASVPTLTAAEQDQLRAAHTGKALPGTKPARCAGSGQAGAGIASGYITIDAVNRCTAKGMMTTDNTPAQPAYFAKGGKGLASDSNVLWGDVIYLNTRLNTAESETLVHVVADPDFFTAGDYTFYGRYNAFDARDDRAPLSSLYYTRYISGGSVFGSTDLIVWRDSREARPATLECGGKPAWAPLGEMQLVVFDEEENPNEVAKSNAFPLTTQKVRVGGATLPVTETFGWLMLDLWHANGAHAQGWVASTMSASGRFSVGNRAIRVDDLCNFGL